MSVVILIFKNDTTFSSTLNVSGFITLKTNTTINGKVNITGNLDCCSGIAINASNAFFSTVDAGKFINTYLNFKYAGGGNDLCYLRQIGVREAHKLALDFHDDDIDARFV